MPNLFINNVYIYPSIIKAINNNALTACYQYIKDSNADEHIELHVEGYKMDEIVQIYIINCGKISNSSTELNCMLKILAKYPEYCTMSSYFSWQRSQLQDYFGRASDTSIMANINDIMVSTCVVDDNFGDLLNINGNRGKINISRDFYRILPFITKLVSSSDQKYIKMPKIKQIKGKTITFEADIGKNITEARPQNDIYKCIYVADDVPAGMFAGTVITRDVYGIVDDDEFMNVSMDKSVDEKGFPDIVSRNECGIEEHIEPNTATVLSGWEILNAYYCPRGLVSRHRNVICTTNCRITRKCRKLHICEYYYELLSNMQYLSADDNPDEIRKYLYDGNFNIKFDAPERIKELCMHCALPLYTGYLDLTPMTGLKVLIITINCSKCDGTIYAPNVQELNLSVRDIKHKITFDMPKLKTITIGNEDGVYVPMEFKYDASYIEVTYHENKDRRTW